MGSDAMKLPATGPFVARIIRIFRDRPNDDTSALVLTDYAESALESLRHSPEGAVEPVAWQYRVMDGNGQWSEWHYAKNESHAKDYLRIYKQAEVRALYAHPAILPTGEVTGVARIAAERQRQVSVEGWTPEHDAAHADGALSLAAACYAMDDEVREVFFGEGARPIPKLWPWDEAWWKPKERIRDLERAGALIAAEIDRLTATANPEGKV